jgi:phospho-N-acetylmuramoyl-pentapeptide-transferase
LITLKIGQPIRYAMQTHLSAARRPWVLILDGDHISTLLWFDLSNRFCLIVLAVIFAIGWADDWRSGAFKDRKACGRAEKYLWYPLLA